MATRNEIAQEISQLQANLTQAAARGPTQGPQVPAQDRVRRAKLQRIEAITNIPLVLYATDFLSSAKVAQAGAEEVQINLRDKTAFLETTSNIPAGPLDVMLHSPGGSPTATESIVALLRNRFEPIRFIIPDVAKSAAAMLAMSGNEVLMVPSAELGPIDPQMLITREGRTLSAPAQAILDQFDAASNEILNDQRRLAVWLPILRDLGPSLRQECLNAIALSKTLVKDWLQKYMLVGDPQAAQKADTVVDYLGNHNNFLAHARRVGIQDLLNLGVGFKVVDLSAPTATVGLLAAVMDAYWAVDVTFGMTGAYKIVEHHAGQAYIQQIQLVQIGIPQQPGPALGQPRQPQGLSRQQRRHPPK